MKPNTNMALMSPIEEQLRLFLLQLDLGQAMDSTIISRTENLVSCGWIDSLKWIALLHKVQAFYAIEILPQDLILNKLTSLLDWQDLISQKVKTIQSDSQFK